MANNPYVNKVQTADGTTIIDISDTTAVASDVASGKYFYTAAGAKTAGTGTGGGGAVEEKQVNFIDYDGTILYSYTKAEANALTALPSNPSHTGLTAQGWNWTLAQIKSQLTNVPDGPVWVGQSYITASGDTEIDTHFAAERLNPTLTLAVNGTITVDWGDGTSADTITGTSLSTRKSQQHTYNAAGDYTIKIHVTSGSFIFYTSSSYLILRKNTTANENAVYASTIKSVRLGSGITSIYDYSFYFCSSLKTITIPKTITSISQYSFNNCYSLKTIIIPSGISAIGNRAYQGCYSLKTVSLPSSITTIGEYAFTSCSALIETIIPHGTTTISQYIFYSCYSLEAISIPSTVASLPNYAFGSCYSLKSLTLGSGIGTIGQYAVNNCRPLTSLTIPSNVTSIAANAFAGCQGMKEYHFLRTSPPSIQSSTFTNIPSDCIIYVPYSADHNVLNAYKGASNWSSQSSKIQEEPAS